MRRKWVPPLAVLAVAFLAFAARRTLDSVDESVFDSELVSSAHPQAPWPDDVLLVTIDEAAISRYSAGGQWPVHRREVVRVFDRLRELGAKTIFYDGSITTRTDPATDASVVRALPGVILPISFTHSAVDSGDEAVVRRASIAIAAPGLPRYAPESLRPPIEPFASAAAGLGHVAAVVDADGLQRRFLPLIVLGTSGRVVPSAPLLALARQRGIDLSLAKASPDELDVPGLPPLRLDEGALRLELASRIDAARPRITMIELLEPKDPEALPARVAGKLAFVYAEDKSDSSPSPLGKETHGGQLLAHALRQIAAGHGARRIPTSWILIALGLLIAAGAPTLATLAPRSLLGGTAGIMLIWAFGQAQIVRHFDILPPLAIPELEILGAGVALIVYAVWRAGERADWRRAPTGTVAIVFTDVQGSTTLWETERQAMQRALALHNACLRALLADLGGYEVKTEGDAFMVAFQDAVAATTWCLTVQATLLALDWPAELLAQPDAAEVSAPNGDFIFRGLRVRMGIHLGEPEPHVDPLTDRMDYFGPMVNKAARVSGAARGGEILVSGDVWKVLAAKRGLLPPIEVRDLGMRALKGLSTETQLVEILPAALATREFPEKS